MDNRYWRELGTSAPACPEGTSPLADQIKAPAALAAAVAGIGIVASAAEAVQMQGKLAPGQMLTTREGGVWRWDGYVDHGEGESAAARRLRQEARLRELEQTPLGLRQKPAPQYRSRSRQPCCYRCRGVAQHPASTGTAGRSGL